MPLSLSYKARTDIPVEVEGIVPDRLKHLALDAIRSQEIFHGNEKITLGEFFDVEGDPADEQIEWHGDLTGVHWIGAKMNSGQMRIHGGGGRHIGSEMKNGTIHVSGNAGDWVGAEMKGGLIQIKGHAGHLVGAAYRGSRRGMTGGTILISGDVGNELGHTMRRGLIVVHGNADDLIGFNMLAGTILVFGKVGIRHGAGMRRGTIGLLEGEKETMLPSFRFGCKTRPLFWTLIEKHLSELQFPPPRKLQDCEFDLYHGDLIEGGRGEILLPST